MITFLPILFNACSNRIEGSRVDIFGRPSKRRRGDFPRRKEADGEKKEKGERASALLSALHSIEMTPQRDRLAPKEWRGELKGNPSSPRIRK